MIQDYHIINTGFNQDNEFLYLYLLKIMTMPKRLVKGEKKIFGVCSGIANYFDIDPTIVRVLFVFGFLVFGSGLLLYLILAIAMPEN